MISKAINVVRHPDFIKLITTSITKEDSLLYRFVRLEYLDDDTYFILYRAEENVILLEIQSSVTSESITRSIEKCLEIFQQMDVLPLLIILCTDKVLASVKSDSVPQSQYPHRKKLNSTFWAKECLLISKDEIDFGEGETKLNLDPLVAATLYFSNDEEQILKCQSCGDPTLQLMNSLQ